jgi:hypothetical protein
MSQKRVAFFSSFPSFLYVYRPADRISKKGASKKKRFKRGFNRNTIKRQVVASGLLRTSSVTKRSAQILYTPSDAKTIDKENRFG